MINNALPNALDDHHHELSWQADAHSPSRTSWSERLRSLAAQVAARFRTRVVQQVPEEAASPSRQIPAAPLPPDESPPPQGEPPQWPTKLLDVNGEAPEPVKELASPPPTSESVEPAPPTRSIRPRKLIVTMPPPDFDPGADYDPLPPPQGFCREKVLLDEIAAAAGRLQVLRRLPRPVVVPRIAPEEEPLVMLLPPGKPSAKADVAPARSSAVSLSSAPPASAPPLASATAVLAASPALVPKPVASPIAKLPPPPPQKPLVPVSSTAPPVVPIRLPVRRRIVTLTRPEPQFVAPRPVAVPVERPPADHSIEECWIGQAQAPPPPVADEVPSADRAVFPRESLELGAEFERTIEAVPETPAPALKALTDANESADTVEFGDMTDGTDPLDVALLLPAGDPEPELRLDLAEIEEPARGIAAQELDPVKAAFKEADELTFEVIDEMPLEFGIDLADEPAPAEQFFRVASPTSAEAPAESPEEAPPPVEIALVLDIEDDDSEDADDPDQPLVEWSGEMGEDEEVLSPGVLVEEPTGTMPTAPAAEGSPIAVGEPAEPIPAPRLIVPPAAPAVLVEEPTGTMPIAPAVEAWLIAVAEPAEPVAAPSLIVAPAAPAARSTPPILVPLRRAVRRVVYVQDGAVLPLSARRLRRTMSKVRPASLVPAGNASPTPAAATISVARPANEAFHDDEL
jgi:hypothetical protein